MRIYEDLRVVQARLNIVQYAIVVVVGILLVVFWHLQVIRARHYQAEAEKNRRRDVVIAAPRGPLLDRHGRMLVENRPSFNVVFNPEHSEDIDRTVAHLGRALQMGEAVIRERIARRSASFQAVVVKADASIADVTAVEARRLELPETSIDVVPLRSYPLAAAAAHALGRVGEISERQLQTKDKEFEGLSPGALIGQGGIEAEYNRALMGKDGLRRVIVNSRGAEVGEAERRPPVVGPNLTLTLDADLQLAAERAFHGRPGSAVALDPQTGEVLAMTSLPAFDPNQFSTGIGPSVWNRLRTDPTTPLMNRVIQGQYAPGSVFKIVMAIAGLEEGLITPNTYVHCPGYFAKYDTVFRCNKPEGHGSVSLRTALGKSCNVYFYTLGVRLEIDRIAQYARKLGLGRATGIDLPAEASGLIPDPQWKARAQKATWYPGETVSVAIGQGQVTTTALQLARLIAAASTGKLATPHLVKSVGPAPLPWPPSMNLDLRPGTLAAVRDGLAAVVEPGGTGWRAGVPGVTVAGKTGTAQVVGRAKLLRSGGTDEAIVPHGWFVAVAPIENPQIALAVIVEHAGGSGVAAALAHEILASYFKVPVRPPTAPALPEPEPTEEPAEVAG